MDKGLVGWPFGVLAGAPLGQVAQRAILRALPPRQAAALLAEVPTLRRDVWMDAVAAVTGDVEAMQRLLQRAGSAADVTALLRSAAGTDPAVLDGLHQQRKLLAEHRALAGQVGSQFAAAGTDGTAQLPEEWPSPNDRPLATSDPAVERLDLRARCVEVRDWHRDSFRGPRAERLHPYEPQGPPQRRGIHPVEVPIVTRFLPAALAGPAETERWLLLLRGAVTTGVDTVGDAVRLLWAATDVTAMPAALARPVVSLRGYRQYQPVRTGRLARAALRAMPGRAEVADFVTVARRHGYVLDGLVWHTDNDKMLLALYAAHTDGLVAVCRPVCVRFRTGAKDPLPEPATREAADAAAGNAEWTVLQHEVFVDAVPAPIDHAMAGYAPTKRRPCPDHLLAAFSDGFTDSVVTRLEAALAHGRLDKRWADRVADLRTLLDLESGDPDDQATARAARSLAAERILYDIRTRRSLHGAVTAARRRVRALK